MVSLCYCYLRVCKLSFCSLFHVRVLCLSDGCRELEKCGSCSVIHSQPLAFPPVISRKLKAHFLATQLRRNGKVVCRMSETEIDPESDNNETDQSVHDEEDQLKSDKHQSPETGMLESNSLEVKHSPETDAQTGGAEDGEDLQVSIGSPLPGVKPQQLDESIRIPKETIDVLRDQVFGFDTFFVTGQEPYEGGVLFKGNLRGQATKSYEKITKRMEDKFGDEYKLFLLINPEDDKPVAVVVPRKSLPPDTTALPEWFAAGAFGLVTLFTLLLRNVPALQSNFLLTFDNLELLKDGLPGALVTLLVLGAHEVCHILVASESGIKLGVPYFIPSWQIGSFGAITRILSIVKKREDLLKFAAAGPLAGFSLGVLLLLLGFILPPSDGLGVVVDASVFHDSLLAGGIAKLLLGDVLKEGTAISVNPLVLWAWAGLLINAINSIPAGELDGGRISFAMWGRKASARLSAAAIGLLGIASLFNDVAFYWVVLIFILQRGPIAPLSEEITDPDNTYITLGIVVLLLGLLVYLPYPFPFTSEAISTF
ncbi:probable zinc metalloprotease EGY2, chloroplastic isoform X2 [Coffea arabica]|uniref:Probable zinc metalloprotease EGY2, chloroplastic isoform X2 n=1 Tax=Coffea arabica TaxID=13443 RepID=A0A6P6W722_COFAR